jgi:hypothetical protein
MSTHSLILLLLRQHDHSLRPRVHP